MTVLTLAMSILAILASAAGVAAPIIKDRRRQRDTPPPIQGRTVVIHTRRPDDQSIRGVMVGMYADEVVLEQPQYITADGPRPIDGPLHVPTANIAWWQEVSA